MKMDCKRLNIATACAGLAAVSFNAGAAIFDNGTYTTDTTSGLNWLDLTETTNLTYSYVSGELSAGGMFEGWRYATDEEVIALFEQFNIDLSVGAPAYQNNAPAPQGLIDIVALLGNTLNEYDSSYDYGVLGITADTRPTSDPAFAKNRMGAFHYSPSNEMYYNASDYEITSVDVANIYLGSYLVADTTTVPVPAAAWLFGSGLLGLIGVARRKKA
jgi:hypothetical protein